MKTSILLAALVSGGLATSAAAQSASNDYIQFNVGSGIVGTVDINAIDGDTEAGTDIDLEAGWFASVAAGTKAGKYPVRIEGELLALSSDIDTGDLEDISSDATFSTQAVMINALYDFTVDSFSPYVGVGVGYARIGYEFENDEQNDRGFAWQLRAGVNYAVSDKVTLDVGYRYLTTPEFERVDSDLALEAEASVHIVSVGARFGF